jgi:hypothetical protein
MKKGIHGFLGFLIAAMAAVFSMTGCIKEDNDDCPMYVRFKYDYNMEFEDLFNEQCTKVELFVFDENGVLIQEITREGDALKDPSFKIPLYLDAGTYTIMAWGGRKDSYDLSEYVIGETTIDDLTLDLKARTESSDEIEPLWNGTPKTFTITKAYGHEEVIDLVRNTNTVNVHIGYLPTAEGRYNPEDLEIVITAANTTYDSYNNFTNARTVSYYPFNVTDTTTVYSINTLRFVKGQDVTISIRDKNTGTVVLAEQDLISLLLAGKPYEPEHPDLEDQEYLDRKYIWDLYINLAEGPDRSYYIAVDIIINGWTVWHQDVNL